MFLGKIYTFMVRSKIKTSKKVRICEWDWEQNTIY